MQQILGSLACVSGPLVFMGDLNRTSRELQGYKGLEKFELMNTPHTFPAHNPRRAIDHIAIAGLHVDFVEVVELQVSDHRAIIVDVK